MAGNHIWLHSVQGLVARGLGRRMVSIGTLLAVVACASTRTASGVGSMGGRAAIVDVENDRFDDIVVYLIRTETPIRLGVVRGASRRTFTLTPALLGGATVALGAKKIGGSMEQTTTPFDLRPGRIASWTIRDGFRTEQPFVRLR